MPITYLYLLARVLKLDEAGQARLLAGTSLLPEELVCLDQQVEEATQLAIVRNALHISGDPALGLRWGSRLHVSAHGPLGVLMSTCANLETALQAAASYYSVRESSVGMVCALKDDDLIVSFRLQIPADEVGLFICESVLLSVQRIAVLMLGGAAVRDHVRVELAYAPPVHAASYAEYLRCACRFHAEETTLRVPLALARRANPYSDTTLYQQALTRCEEWMQARIAAGRWSDRVLQLLRQNPGRLWMLLDVAHHFHLSPRTLIRYLKGEGTSYQDILDEELGRLACLYLDSRTYTVESVATALGYQDVSSFRRAFKRWYGLAPTDYLQQQRKA